jgi:hypothetical protein
VPDGGVRTDEEDTEGSIHLSPHDLLQPLGRCFGFNGGRVVVVVNMMSESDDRHSDEERFVERVCVPSSKLALSVTE